jgi:outer membrane PBP1 activator LpoA protein
VVSTIGAAELMRRAARISGPGASDTYLSAARAFDIAEDIDGLAMAFEQVDPSDLPASRLALYYLLKSSIEASRSDWPAAHTALETGLTHAPAEGLMGEYAHARTQLCSAHGDYICAADSLIDEYLLDPEAPGQTDAIWQMMDRGPGQTLKVLAQSSEHSSWWSLKEQLSSSFSIADQRRRLVQWNTQNADHPLMITPPAVLGDLVGALWEPEHIALILPLEGVFGNAGRAVRDGFISAYLHDEDPGKPKVTIYNSQDGESLGVLFERILTDGADMIVGPLTKPNVEAFNALNPHLPVLALNYLSDDPALPQATSTANIKQLGLAIEDEANTVIDRLLVQDAQRLLVLHSDADWSRRAANQIAENWPHEVTSKSFKDLKTVTESIGEAMLVAQSRERHQAIVDDLREEVEFLPRARQDLDAVVLFVSNIEANAVVPALRYHFADDLPVYATSQVLRNVRTSAGLDTLAGFQICDMPFNLITSDFTRSLKSAFSLRADNLTPLFVLGVDAYSVSNQMTLLSAAQPRLLANTGDLTLNPAGQFRRALVWGYVSDGEFRAIPVVVDTAASSAGR